MKLDPFYSGPVFKIRKTDRLPASDLTRGERVIRFIERYCVVPEGDLVGQPVVLADFQKLFILSIYDNVAITDTAILSIARKNAKTGTIAFILLAHLVGPEAVRNSRIISGAMSREQAAEVYNLAAKTVELSPQLRRIVKPIPSQKKLIGLPLNVEYQAISAEGKTAHGKSPILAILDEVGQIQGPSSDFVDAVTTAQGAYTNPLLIYISTQAATDNDFFSIQIDDAKKHKPAKTVCHVYAAEQDAKVTHKRAWKAANPALGLFRSVSDMEKQAKKAARMPSFENTFRNLNLNQRVSTFSPFVSVSVWQGCKARPLPLGDAMRYWIGLDLSQKLDLTAAVVLAEHNIPPSRSARTRARARYSVHPYFWTPAEGIHDRAARDRQPYDVWVKQGMLLTCPGKSVNYAHVVEYIGNDIASQTDAELMGIAFDRWRIDQFKKDMEEGGYSFPMVPFGQGFKDMSPALDAAEEMLINQELAHGMHPVLTMCAANAAVATDAAKNRKLDKNKATGRIDGMQALVQAIGLAKQPDEEPEREPEYQMIML